MMCSACAWLDARPKGVFDMFRLLNAATEPVHGCAVPLLSLLFNVEGATPPHARTRPQESSTCSVPGWMHDPKVSFDMFRLLYAATQPLPVVIHSRHLALLHRLLHVCHLFHAPCSGGDFLPG
eukprot:CAMPEP_0172023694 /NCGR_PEP_ID=MMETSP1041-20130122/14923_1 /TAXON_ID=464988 /ORGANISM="Hemiselmis andersenii, Strain CCMP439" /LENGTH=122 /DNA_ID=CAMNT_0012679185 /DNA_START=446 /DNA_END=811 /DNA_ORIENTATION=-